MATLPVGKLPGDLLKSLLATLPVDDDVIVGPGVGRDAAAVRFGDRILVFKSDPVTFPTNDPGWYLVNVNANDIACMGAEPRWLLVSALLPEGQTTPEIVESIFGQLRDSCEEIGCTLIGGHTEITEGLTRPLLVGQMVGVATEDTLVDPSTAEAGDAVLLIGGIAVEGTSILATEALELLESQVEPEILTKAGEFARNPGISVVRYARHLMDDQQVTVKAMHDPTEGGLATGLIEIAEATGLGIDIDASSVHIYPETREITRALALDPWGLIASGALIAVVSADQAGIAVETLTSRGIIAGQIGTLTSDPAQRTLRVNDECQQIPIFAVDEIARFFGEQ
jgi:hydrogenase expression/formation protein HypE